LSFRQYKKLIIHGNIIVRDTLVANLARATQARFRELKKKKMEKKKTREKAASDGNVTDGDSRRRRGRGVTHARNRIHIHSLTFTHHPHACMHAYSPTAALARARRGTSRALFTWPGESMRPVGASSSLAAGARASLLNAAGLLLITRSVVGSFCELLEVMLYRDK